MPGSLSSRRWPTAPPWRRPPSSDHERRAYPSRPSSPADRWLCLLIGRMSNGVYNKAVKKKRKKENRQPKGGMGGRYTATTQGFQGGDSVVLAVTYPWAPASSYLSSQSVADSRCNPHATPRSSYSRRCPSRRFFLCRSALPCLALHSHCCLSVPCSRGFSCLSAQFRSPRCVLWPLKFIQLTSRQNDSSDAHSDHERKKERKKTDNPREGWEDGTPPPHRDFKEGTVWC